MLDELARISRRDLRDRSLARVELNGGDILSVYNDGVGQFSSTRAKVAVTRMRVI